MAWILLSVLIVRSIPGTLIAAIVVAIAALLTTVGGLGRADMRLQLPCGIFLWITLIAMIIVMIRMILLAVITDILVVVVTMLIMVVWLVALIVCEVLLLQIRVSLRHVHLLQFHRLLLTYG